MLILVQISVLTPILVQTSMIAPIQIRLMI